MVGVGGVSAIWTGWGLKGPGSNFGFDTKKFLWPNNRVGIKLLWSNYIFGIILAWYSIIKENKLQKYCLRNCSPHTEINAIRLFFPENIYTGH